MGSGEQRKRYLAAFAEGDFIFREGDRGREMFIVHEGRVEIVATDATAGRRLAVLDKGDFFGEMSLLEDMPRNASARALSAVRVVRVDRATFDRMLREDPEIAVRIMRKLSRRLREATRMLRERVAGDSGETGPHRLVDAAERRLEPAAAPSPAAALAEESEASAADSGAEESGERPRATKRRLVHPGSQTVFALDEESGQVVGRRDPVTGISPAIDLTPIDPERSSSRQHALVHVRGERCFLVEDIGTTNGTFVNGERLAPGVEVEVSPGDVLRFGLVDLELHGG